VGLATLAVSELVPIKMFGIFSSLGVVVIEKATGYSGGDVTKGYEGVPMNPDCYSAPNAPPCTDCQ